MSTPMTSRDIGRTGTVVVAALAVALTLLATGAAEAACSSANRVDHGNAECLYAWWKNRGLLKKSPYHVSNQCSEFGKVVAKVDLVSARDRTIHLDDGLPRDGDTRHRIRGISCCSDMGICNRSDAVTNRGCRERFQRVSPARTSCSVVSATAVISGDNYECRISAFCQIAGNMFIDPHSGITVPWLAMDEVHNCRGDLTRGPCPGRERGPSWVSVSDARVEEAEGASLDFAVTLSRARSERVHVRFATADGTARAGSDYRAISGRLTFRPGQTEKTVSVTVLDDEMDEGPETLTLTIWNLSPSHLSVANPVGTGTIVNTDRMPAAWTARFGRTVADQVLDAVEARMRTEPAPGAEARLAGWQIGRGPALPDSGALPGSPGPRQAVAEGEWMPGSSFSLTAETDDGGFVSVWGRGAVARFSGREPASGQSGGRLPVEGEVASGMLGADWTHGRWTTGLLVSKSLGDGDYAGTGVDRVSASLGGVWPWARHALGERLSIGGVAGYGEGDVTLFTSDADGVRTGRIRTHLDLSMAAVGLRGVLVPPRQKNSGVTLAVTADARGARTHSAAARGGSGKLAAVTTQSTRLRVGLEGARSFTLGDGSTFTTDIELGVRRDGGDAETGFGVDIGGGLAWTHRKSGLGAELRGHGLLAHESKGFRERGASAALSWNPLEGELGPRLRVARFLGIAARGGSDSLLGSTPLAGLTASENGEEAQRRRLEARLGCGFAAFGDRFTATPEIAVGLSDDGRDYSLGWRLAHGRGSDGGALELALELLRSEASGDRRTPPEHVVGLRATVRF